MVDRVHQNNELPVSSRRQGGERRPDRRPGASRLQTLYGYSGGQVTNIGAHTIDMAQWALGMDDTGPVEFEDLGSVWPPEGHLYDTATETHFRARYANGVELVCHSQDCGGALVEGSDGWICIGPGTVEASSEALLESEIGADEIRLPVSHDHYRNFIDCVKSRAEPIEPVEVGHRTATTCHCGNIAMRLKRKLEWDPENELFVNDDEANRMLRRPYREPWGADLSEES